MFKNSYFSRKLHSLLGVIPVGFFLIEHLLTNYSAAKGGPESFLEHVEWLHSLPLVLALEIFGIWIPLAYHAIYGLYVAYTARNNVNNYGYFRNVMFFLQRVTGVVTFLFVAWHFFPNPFSNCDRQRRANGDRLAYAPNRIESGLLRIVCNRRHRRCVPLQQRHVVVPGQLGHYGRSARAACVDLRLDGRFRGDVRYVHYVADGILGSSVSACNVSNERLRGIGQSWRIRKLS